MSRRLVVVFDVSDLTNDEIVALEFEVVVQAEASERHPDVPVVGSRLTGDPIRVEAIDRDVIPREAS